MKLSNSVKQKIICLIQTRMDSTRLPGKAMKLINGKPMIYRVFQALSKSNSIGKIVIVTSENKNDNELIKFLEKNNMEYFRGSKDDVLDRYYQAAKKLGADLIIRITGDCPLIDSDIVDSVIEKVIRNNLDYASNVEVRTFPRGYDVEVFTYETLKKIHQSTNDPDDREHVTLYLRRNQNLFKIGNITAQESKSHPEWRVCVDTKQDLDLIRKIFMRYRKKNRITYEDVIEFFKKYPKMTDVNKKIEQKRIKNRVF